MSFTKPCYLLLLCGLRLDLAVKYLMVLGQLFCHLISQMLNSGIPDCRILYILIIIFVNYCLTFVYFIGDLTFFLFACTLVMKI